MSQDYRWQCLRHNWNSYESDCPACVNYDKNVYKVYLDSLNDEVMGDG